MTSQSADADIPIAPARTLSSARLLDIFTVAYWTLWSPRLFARYGAWLVDTRLEQPPPDRFDLARLDNWRTENTGHRELLNIAFIVCVLMFGGLAFVNTLCVFPLFPDQAEEAAASSVLFVFIFWFLFLMLVTVGWHATADRGNVGPVLIYALPGTLLAAVILLMLWWSFYLPVYLARPSLAVQLIFVFYGFGIGYAVNFLLALAGFEFRSWWLAVLACTVPIVLAFAFFTLAVGVDAPLPEALTGDAYAIARLAWSRWTLGFLLGILRPLEWLLLQWLPLPGTHSHARNHAWWTPGATILPANKLRSHLQEWLQYDWQQGVRIASELSSLSCQRLPLARAVQQHLAAINTAELPEHLAVVCDSGATCTLDMVQPPLQKPTRGAKAAPPAGATAAQQHRYQLEFDLADALHQHVQAPTFQTNNPTRTLQAAYWYFSRGYLFQAADLVQQMLNDKAAYAAVTATPAFVELSALIDTYQQLQEFRPFVVSPAPKLPRRPPTCLRPQVWALVDRFGAAARWLWRSQRCPQRAAECRAEFAAALAAIEHDARAGHLADRWLILGTCEIWRRKLRGALADPALQAQFVPVSLRNWEAVYPELGRLCPWQQAAEELYACWQPGNTVITFVDSQPGAGAREALWEASNCNPLPCFLTYCDLSLWERQPAALIDFCILLCNAVADTLGATARLPDAQGLRALTPDTTLALIKDLCAADPDTTLVLVIAQAHLLFTSSRSSTTGTTAPPASPPLGAAAWPTPPSGSPTSSRPSPPSKPAKSSLPSPAAPSTSISSAASPSPTGFTSRGRIYRLPIPNACATLFSRLCDRHCLCYTYN